MAGVNGTTAESSLRILRLGDLTPEKRPIQIERGDRVDTVYGYVFGRRCTGRVRAELARITQARMDALAAVTVVNENGQRVITDNGVAETAWRDFLRGALQTLIPDGLSTDELDLISGDDQMALDILVALDYWTRGVPAEGDGETEEATPLTTAESSPISSPPTDPSTT